MNRILRKQQLSQRVFLLEVEAPLIARARKAGHFVIVRCDKHGERIPLTIAAADKDRGSICLIVQEVGVSSTKLCSLSEGEMIEDVVGPLGKATDIQRFGTVVCACGGVGAAPMLPIANALKQLGNKVITVLAARNADAVILEEELRKCSDELIVMTDDGSRGTKGLVTNGVEIILKREHVDKCFAIGPAVMMKFVCQLTKQYEVPTDVSLNTIMVDGTGMCGACRVTVDGHTKFVCVDGPEFDGHKVDFDEMISRLKAFRGEEKKAEEHFEEEHETEGLHKEGKNDNGERNFNPADCKNSNGDCFGDNGACSEDSEADKSRNAEWRKALRKAINPKLRMAKPRCTMPEIPAKQRARLLRVEVNQGLSEEQAVAEAQRCLDCANPGCVKGCPVGIDIPRFIKHIESGNHFLAAATLKETSALPAVCGRVCPQEKQCESQCIHLKTGGKAVAIGYLERFAADYDRSHNHEEISPTLDKKGIKIGVVGSGPAGLSFANSMQRKGYDVTVFEALHEIGGVLKYGIPEFRLPNKIVDHEISSLEALGVKFVKDCIVGKTITVSQLKDEGFRGLFVASGAGLPNFMGIPGENYINIMSSNEYLTRVNLMDASNPDSDTPIFAGKHMAVVGGGNTAMDSVRTALRLGAESATIIYRRSEAEMPARLEEVNHAKEEGVKFLTLHNPLRYIADDEGKVCAVELQKMRLGEPDSSGRCRPEPIPGETVTLNVDLVIVSIGVSPNPLIPNSVEGIATGRHGTITVDDDMQSSIPFIYAGGDIVRGGATVILAMGDGRKAAECMDSKLSQIGQ